MIFNFIKKSCALVLVSTLVLPMSSLAVSATATDTFRVFLTVDADTTPTPTPTPGGGGGGTGTQFPVITNILVTPSINGAVVTYNTVIPATSTVSYGKTVNVSDGRKGNNIFSTNHSITLTNLSSDTLYTYVIEAMSPTGARATSGTLQFRTLPQGPVVNVLQFTATAREKDIELKWKMPQGQENDVVRIVRSENFYPTEINDGQTIFEGAKVTNILDINVLRDVRYFYTLFVKDSEGKYSSGAVADARITFEGEETQLELFDRLSKAPFVDARISSLSLNDFIFSQPNREDFSTAGNETLFIEGDKNLTIKLSYERVPELLKTIAVTLSDPDDKNKKFSFLLRINDGKTFYEATIAPLGRSGEYKMDVAVVDYKNQGLKRITGNLLAVVSKPAIVEGIFNIQSGFTINDLMIYLILVLAIIALAYMSARRIDESYLREVWSRYRPRIRR